MELAHFQIPMYNITLSKESFGFMIYYQQPGHSSKITFKPEEWEMARAAYIKQVISLCGFITR